MIDKYMNFMRPVFAWLDGKKWWETVIIFLCWLAVGGILHHYVSETADAIWTFGTIALMVTYMAISVYQTIQDMKLEDERDSLEYRDEHEPD